MGFALLLNSNHPLLQPLTFWVGQAQQSVAQVPGDHSCCSADAKREAEGRPNVVGQPILHRSPGEVVHQELNLKPELPKAQGTDAQPQPQDKHPAGIDRELMQPLNFSL